MTKSVFSIKEFEFPYREMKFPGQHTEEKILFITREGPLMLLFRLQLVVIGAVVILLMWVAGRQFLAEMLPVTLTGFDLASLGFILIFVLLGFWWIYTLWRKSLFIVTNRRLTKFIHTTPFNRYQLSLGLDKIVDTGSYQKGLMQSLTGYGYLVARSAAGNIKNFYILNIPYSEDLQNYINKLLFSFNEEKQKLDNFRPFIPHLKGEARKKYIRKVAPEYDKTED